MYIRNRFDRVVDVPDRMAESMLLTPGIFILSVSDEMRNAPIGTPYNKTYLAILNKFPNVKSDKEIEQSLDLEQYGLKPFNDKQEVAKSDEPVEGWESLKRNELLKIVKDKGLYKKELFSATKDKLVEILLESE